MKLRTWWKTWSGLVRKLVMLSGTVASLIGLLVVFLPSPKDLPWWVIALLTVAAFFLVALVVLEFVAHRGRRVYAKNDAEGIRKYMHDWIEHGGRVAIWTRDMSWAKNAETRRLLQQKAEQNELILCLPEPNSLATDLASAGAELCTYGSQFLESPASRFTIVFFGRDGARVATGRAHGDSHVIDEFDARGHPAFYLAEDLIALVRAQSASQAIP